MFNCDYFFAPAYIITMDKVYIDGSCEFLYGYRQMNCQPNIFRNQEVPGPIRTANIRIGKFQCPSVLVKDHAQVSCLYKSESRDSLFQNAQAKHRLMFYSYMIHLCILYLLLLPFDPIFFLYKFIELNLVEKSKQNGPTMTKRTLY